MPTYTDMFYLVSTQPIFMYSLRVIYTRSGFLTVQLLYLHYFHAVMLNDANNANNAHDGN